MMIKQVFFSISILLVGCSATKDMIHEKADTPPPKQDLFAFGSHYNTRGATEIATENANKFCYRWRMVAAIKNKQVAERGVLPPNALAEIASNENIPPWSPSKAKWEVRLIYNCL
jgi:hypothetical protein